MKASQQHNRIAIVNSNENEQGDSNSSNGYIDIFDFDSSTGELKNLRTITIPDVTTLYGLEFSPDGNQLYFAGYGRSNGKLYQYDISGPTPVLVTVSPLEYSTKSTTDNIKGGGLKLGPDGNIYIPLHQSNMVGVITDPNSTDDLSSRYKEDALELKVTYQGVQFSTGLTRPAQIVCNTNTPPTTVKDEEDMCVSATSRTAKFAVLKNDSDADPGNIIYLTGVDFQDNEDRNRASLAINHTSDSVILTVKDGVSIPAGHVFNIIYHVKDNGTPASQCATGELKVTVLNTAADSDIKIDGETTVCYGTSTTLTAGTDLSIASPIFRWYKSLTETAPFHTGAIYTTSLLQEDTVLYVSVSGDNYCENEADGRKEVKVTVNPLCAHDDHVSVTCDEEEEFDVLLNDSISESCKSALTLSITEGAKHGVADLDGTKITYRYTGTQLAVHDSITYKISCSAVESTAKVYFTISHVGSAFVDDVWYFGENSQGIRFTNNGSVYTAHDASGESQVHSHENSLTVSSPYCDGQNIFYTSHNQIFNSHHELMKNGNFMGHQSVADGLAACYIGENKYLFFSVTGVYEDISAHHFGLKAYVIDMNEDNGKGEVIDSVIVEHPSENMSESIELIASDHPGKYWLVYAFKETTYHLRVCPVDVSQPLLSMIGNHLTPTTALSITTAAHHPYTLKASQQHNRIAIANGDDRTVDVFEFNYTNGTLSKRRTTQHSITGVAYGVEFSPDGNQLYAAGYTALGSVTPMLCQFEISDNALTYKDEVKYWTHESNLSKGGGLKLGPDGKIYVMQSYNIHNGVITDPDLTTSLSGVYGRYDSTGIEMTVDVNSYALQFSTGITRPAMMMCNMNNPPEPEPDYGKLCIGSASRSVSVNVLKNDTDPDKGENGGHVDKLYLTGAHFLNPSPDESLATLSVNAADSTVTLTLLDDATIPAGGHVFKIVYDVKDDGLPASQCATGMLEIATYSPPTYPDIRLRICPDAGDVNLSKYLDTVNGIVESSIQWTSQIAGIPIVSPSGKVSSNDLKSARVYTFTYTLADMCGQSPQRKVYLEKLTPDRMRPLKDTVVMCYRYAEAVQINQLFGIEANGKWEYYSSATDDVKSYVSKSTSPTYAGAVVMNGKAIYEDDDILLASYHGYDNVKTVTFIYESDIDGCLHGVKYRLVIVLTEDIVN
jgi:hypothetical protein